MPTLVIEQGEFQLGEGGPIVKITDEKVEIKTADDSGYVTLKANFESATAAGIPTTSILRMQQHASPPTGLQNHDIWMNTSGQLIKRFDGSDYYLFTGDPI